MYVGFSKHDVSKGSSSYGLIMYLDKENNISKFDIQTSNMEFIPIDNNIIIEEETLYYQIKQKDNDFKIKLDSELVSIKDKIYYRKSDLLRNLKESDLYSEDILKGISKQTKDEINTNNESFFSHNYDINKYNNPIYNVNDIIKEIDNNKATSSKVRPNFYTFCISPSKDELKHLEEKAQEELSKRGIDINDEHFLFWQKKIKHDQLKIYTQEIMNIYAESMNKQVFSNQTNLPTDKERLKINPIINQQYEDWKASKGFILDKKEYIQFDKFEIDKNILSFEYNNQSIKTYFPTNTFKINNDILYIDSTVLNDTVNTYLRKEIFDSEILNINDKKYTTLQPTDSDNVFLINTLYSTSTTLNKLEGEYNLYFSKDEFVLSDSSNDQPQFLVSSLNLELKKYNKTLLELKKKYPEISNKIYTKLLHDYDFNLVNNELYFKDSMSDSLKKVDEKQVKKFNTEVTVRTNQEIENVFNLSNPLKSDIKDWNTKINLENNKTISAEVIRESQKALFIQVKKDDQIYKYWTPKNTNEFEYYDFYGNQVNDEFKGEKSLYLCSINEELLDNQVNIRKALETKDIPIYLKEHITFSQSITDKEFYKIDDNNFSICLDKEQVDTGQISNKDFKVVRYSSFINSNKLIFKKEYENLITKIDIENKDLDSRAKQKMVDKSFVDFLNDKGIHIDKKYCKVDTIVKEQDKWKITTNATEFNYEKDVVFYVRENDIKNNQLFVSEERFTSLINQAIERDKLDHEKISLADFKLQEEVIKTKNGDKELYSFQVKIEGLKKPIELSFLKEHCENKEIERYIYEREYHRAIEAGIKKEYGNIKEEIKLKVWKENGYDVSKRALTADDLLYYAKIEEKRSYNDNDIEVIHNKSIDKLIVELKEKGSNKKEIAKAEQTYIRHKENKCIIRSGDLKEGDNTHIHVVLSRSDKFSVNPKDKVGVSPLVSRKGMNGNDGINRDLFFKNIEAKFDMMFEYNRPTFEKYEYKNSLVNQASSTVGNYFKSQLTNNLGLNDIKQELNIKQQLKNDITGGIPLPTLNPIRLVAMVKNPVQLGIEIIKQITRL